MNDENSSGIHWSFWAIGAVTLIWNLMGVMNFFMQMNPDTLAAMPESHRAIAEVRPAWATGAFGIGVICGALGSLLLLFRKSAAFYLFVLSLFGVIVTIIHAYGMAGSVINFSTFEIVLAVVMPPVVAAFLIWYSKWVQSKGWISQGQ